MAQLAEKIDNELRFFLRSHVEDWADYVLYIDNNLDIEIIDGYAAVEEDKFDSNLSLINFVFEDEEVNDGWPSVMTIKCFELAEKYGPLFEFGAL